MYIKTHDSSQLLPVPPVRIPDDNRISFGNCRRKSRLSRDGLRDYLSDFLEGFSQMVVSYLSSSFEPCAYLFAHSQATNSPGSSCFQHSGLRLPINTLALDLRSHLLSSSHATVALRPLTISSCLAADILMLPSRQSCLQCLGISVLSHSSIEYQVGMHVMK